MEHVLLFFSANQNQIVIEVGLVPEKGETVAIDDDQHDLTGQIALTQHISQALHHMLGGDSVQVFSLDPNDRRAAGKAQLPG